MAINDDVAPPPPIPRLRTIQRRLFNAIRPELSQFLHHKDKSSVEAWIRMDRHVASSKVNLHTDPVTPPPGDRHLKNKKPIQAESPATPKRVDKPCPPATPSITPSPAVGEEDVNTPPAFKTPPVMPQQDSASRINNLLSFFGSGISTGSPDVEFMPRALQLAKELEMEIGCHHDDA